MLWGRCQGGLSSHPLQELGATRSMVTGCCSSGCMVWPQLGRTPAKHSSRASWPLAGETWPVSEPWLECLDPRRAAHSDQSPVPTVLCKLKKGGPYSSVSLSNSASEPRDLTATKVTSDTIVFTFPTVSAF